MKTSVSGIELLETRIAPAAVFSSPTTATYIDEDGDAVTVKFTKPILTPGPGGNVSTILVTTANGNFDHLDTINLVGVTGAAGTGISVTAKLRDNGDGLVNVGRISSDVDLGAVTIKGDLNEIDAGDNITTTAGLKSLTVHSLGSAAFLSGSAFGTSAIQGALGVLKVTTNFIGGYLAVTGNPAGSGTIGSITIGGNLSGLTAQLSGAISATGDIGNVKIGGSIFGGAGNDSGNIFSSTGKIGNVTIGGSVHGGSAPNAGSISAAGTMGAVKIGQDLVGGTVNETGYVYARTGMAAVTIGGNVKGGSLGGGVVVSDGTMGAVKIGRDVVGGGFQSGLVYAKTGLKSATVGGSVIGGSGSQSGSITSNGNIGAVKIGGDLRGGGVDNTVSDNGEVASFGGSVGNVTIKGDAVGVFGTTTGCIIAVTNLGAVKIGGNIYSTGDGEFLIRAGGTAAKPLAIASVTVTGSVNHMLILAGYNLSNMPVLGSASIGAVKVGGDWFASSISAGVRNSSFPNFGDLNDNVIIGASGISKIASITIGGQIAGTFGGTDHFGFVAQKIGNVKVGGQKVTFEADEFKDRAIGLTGDFRIHEVALNV